MVLALNTVSGQICDVSPRILAHPNYKDILVPVDADAKPYNPVMYQPGTVAEKDEQRSGLNFLKKRQEEVVQEHETKTDNDIEEEN